MRTILIKKLKHYYYFLAIKYVIKNLIKKIVDCALNEILMILKLVCSLISVYIKFGFFPKYKAKNNL